MLPTASSLERVGRCLGSAILPKVDEVSDAATRGQVIHAYLARVAEVGREEALTEVPEEYWATCAVIDLDVLPTSALEVIPELAMAYNPETGVAQELGRNIGRRYPSVGPGDFVGTADVVTVSPSEIFVADFKTGHGVVTAARENAQLRFLGLAAARLFGRRRLRVAIIRLAEDGTPFFDSADFDAFELDVIADELRDLARRIDQSKSLLEIGQPPPVSVGPHCRRCPSLAHCPGQTALIRRLATQPEVIGDSILEALTTEMAGVAWARLKVAEEVIRRVREALYAYARERSIPLASGMVLGEVETQRRAVDGRLAYEVLLRHHGEEVARAAVDLDASQASIERALRVVAADTGAKLAGLKRKVLAELEAAGGVRVKTSRTVREHRPETATVTGRAA